MNLTFPGISKSKPHGQFNHAVHVLRAFATLMVFSVHLCDSFNTYFFPNDALFVAAMPYIKRFGTFGVELFFVISGYVIMNSLEKYDLRDFLLRRLIRIYPVFLFFTLLFFVLNEFVHLRPESLSIEPLLLNLGFLDIYFGTQALSPNAWSLTFEANFYLLAGLGCFLLRNRATFPLILLAAAALAFLFCFPIATYFLVGCLLYSLRNLQPASLPRSAELAVFAAWCVLAATIDHESSSAANVALLAATGIFFFVVTTPDGSFKRLAAVRPIFFFGTISYSFYLAHPYAYYPLRVMFQKLSLGNWNVGLAAAIYFPCITVAAVISAYFIYRVLEVAPYHAAFGEAVFKRPPPPAERAGEGRPATVHP
jgi:peptidoglycan/LPS O-acetylase OafA/YrhL